MRDAPIIAFDRINNHEPITIRAGITQPHVVIAPDPSLLSIINVTSGLKEKGIIIINTKKSTEQIRAEVGIKEGLATINATKIARELLGVPIVNTTMIGALIKATNIIKVESMNEPLEKRFGRLAERNFKAMEEAYRETSIAEQQ